MTSHERAMELLAQTKLYNLSVKSPTSIEFSLYARHLDYWYGDLEYLLENMFVDTVDEDNVIAYQKLFGLPYYTSLPSTRSIITKRLAITTLDFTVEGVKRCLSSGGIEAELTENFATNKVTVKILSELELYSDTEVRNEFIRSCLPCHVEAVIV